MSMNGTRVLHLKVCADNSRMQHARISGQDLTKSRITTDFPRSHEEKKNNSLNACKKKRTQTQQPANKGFVMIKMLLVSQRNVRKKEKKAFLKPYFASSCDHLPCLYDEYAGHKQKFVKNRKKTPI